MDAPKKPEYIIFDDFCQKGIFPKKSDCDVHLQMWP